MNDLLRQFTNHKVERRRQLVALPVEDDLRMLEEMTAAARAISATRPPRPARPMQGKPRLPVPLSIGSRDRFGL